MPGAVAGAEEGRARPTGGRRRRRSGAHFAVEPRSSPGRGTWNRATPATGAAGTGAFGIGAAGIGVPGEAVPWTGAAGSTLVDLTSSTGGARGDAERGDASPLPSPGPPSTGDEGERPARLGIDPRFRQRRIDVKREEGRRRLRWLITATSALTIVALGIGAFWSPLFVVRHARVLGTDHTPVAAVLAAARLDHHPLMVEVDAARAVAAIDRLPWVARADVRRQWPDAVTISVAERVPVAVVGPVGDIGLVDVSGRVLAQAPMGARLPEVELDSVPGRVGSVGGPAPGPPGSDIAPGYQPGLAAAAAMPPALVSRTLAIVVGTDGSLTLRLSSGATALLGDGTQLAQKLIAVLTLVERVRIGTDTIDVTVPALPVLRAGP